MSPSGPDEAAFRVDGHEIGLGERRDLVLPLTESYSGGTIGLPVHVWRGAEPGPALFVAAAVHGDELNGIGIVRRLLLDPPFTLARGTLVLAPVVNVLGFERHSRYLPDRRDLNRSFPGSASGSLAGRTARRVFDAIVSGCDFGIDLHTAAVRRTNYPNVRGDLASPAVRRIAMAFGCELVVNGRGPKGSLRREATRSGCATILLEAGEVWKIEPAVTEVGVRGVRNVLIELGMAAGKPELPRYQVRVDKTVWVRADFGGILQFHVAPGEIVAAGQLLATNRNLLGARQNEVRAPADGVVLGMTTLPAVTPGDPMFHLALPRGGMRRLREVLAHAPIESTRGEPASVRDAVRASGGGSRAEG